MAGQDSSPIDPLFVDTNITYDMSSQQPFPVYTNGRQEPLLSMAIGDSLRTVQMDPLYPVEMEMPTLPAVNQPYLFNEHQPFNSSPFLPTTQKAATRTQPLVRQKSSGPSSQIRRRGNAIVLHEYSRQHSPTGTTSASILSASWLKKMSRNPETNRMMHFVQQDDLDIPKSDAIQKIHDRMIQSTGCAATRLQIERLLYNLKRTRRENFRRQNDELFQGLNWDFQMVSKLPLVDPQVDHQTDHSCVDIQ